MSAAACTSSPSTTPTGPASASCPPSACVQLGKAAKAVSLVPANGVTGSILVAGNGTVLITDAAAARPAVLTVQVTAVYGPASLTAIPGFHLVFAARPNSAVLVAQIKNGAAIPVGKAGTVHGNTVDFAPIPAHPPIGIATDQSYQLEVYLGGLTVAVTCNQSVDMCSGGSTSTPGKALFTAIGDTATLTPAEVGPANTFSLLSDTCNKTDDPSAGGNWATIAPGPGQTATSFTVTAKKAGANGNPSHCAAIVVDASGEQVQIDIGVTLSSVGVGE